jgi:hypothetical protein
MSAESAYIAVLKVLSNLVNDLFSLNEVEIIECTIGLRHIATLELLHPATSLTLVNHYLLLLILEILQ